MVSGRIARPHIWSFRALGNMAVFRNTAYTEHAPEAPNEKFSPGSSSITRQFDIVDGTFQGRLQAAYDFLGYANVLSVALGGPYYISRVTPMPYGGLTPDRILKAPGALLAPPDITRRFHVQAISRTEPLGLPLGVSQAAVPGGTAAANYPRARLTCEVVTHPFQIKEDSAILATTGPLIGFPDEGTALASGWLNTRYIIRHRDPYSRLLRVPYGVMGINNVGLKEGFPKREGGATYYYTWIGVPLLGLVSGFNDARVGSMINTLNNATFDNCPAGTLALDNYKTREYQGSFGEPLADVTFTMLYAPHPSSGANFAGGAGPAQGQQMGWNYYWTSVNGKLDYYPITGVGGNQPPFQFSDFSSLFRP